MKIIALIILILAMVLFSVPSFGASLALSATWTAPTTNTDGSAVSLSGFNLYNTTSGSPVLVNTGGLIPTTYGVTAYPFTVTQPAVTTTFTFDLTAVGTDGVASAASSVASYTYTVTPPPTETPNPPSKLLIILGQISDVFENPLLIGVKT